MRGLPTSAWVLMRDDRFADKDAVPIRVFTSEDHAEAELEALQALTNVAASGRGGGGVAHKRMRDAVEDFIIRQYAEMGYRGSPSTSMWRIIKCDLVLDLPAAVMLKLKKKGRA